MFGDLLKLTVSQCTTEHNENGDLVQKSLLHGPQQSVCWPELAGPKCQEHPSQSLMKVDSSTILEPFGSNQFMSCSQAMSSF